MDKVVERLWICVHKLVFVENNQKISKKLCKSAWQKGKYMVIYASCRRWGDVRYWKSKWKKLEKSFGKGIDKADVIWYDIQAVAVGTEFEKRKLKNFKKVLDKPLKVWYIK